MVAQFDRNRDFTRYKAVPAIYALDINSLTELRQPHNTKIVSMRLPVSTSNTPDLDAITLHENVELLRIFLLFVFVKA